MCVYIYMHRGLLCCSMIKFTMFLLVAVVGGAVLDAKYFASRWRLFEVLAGSVNDVNYMSADGASSISMLVCVGDNPPQ